MCFKCGKVWTGQALAEAQGRITQLGQAFQRGTRVSGQAVDTRVFERPDKWNGRKKGVIKRMFRDEGFSEDHRSAVVGHMVESRDQDGGAGERAVGQGVDGLAIQGGLSRSVDVLA